MNEDRGSRSWLGVLCLIAVLTACGPLEPLSVPEGCNPIAHEGDCMLPFPSDYFTVEDATLPSGRRVSFSPQALPRTDGGDVIDPTQLHPADGFSYLTPIFAVFPGGVDDGNLIFHTDDPARSQGDESPTVLLSVDGERVLHFAEIDPRVTELDRQALFVRPLVRLRDGTRYIVALRNLESADGTPLPAPEGFRRIRDRKTKADPLLEPLAARYEDEVFPVLEAAGIDRESLQLAWDFTTATREHVTADMMVLRDAAIAQFEQTPPRVTLESVQDDVDAEVFRRITGTLQVPLFLESTEGGALLHRAADGTVQQNGVTEVPFVLLIPRSVEAAGGNARFLQFGHGFFGSRSEVEGSFVKPFVERTGMVVIGVDWWGMALPDKRVLLGDLLGDISVVGRFLDRVHQSMVNQIAVTYAMQSTLAALPELSIGGQLAYDPTRTYFYGLSNGHILGGTYLALSPHVSRAVLNVGGAGFNLMMYRAEPFNDLVSLMETQIADRLEQQKVTALMQLGLDRIDPITYAPNVIDDPLPGGVTDRRILMQIGIGDPTVPNLASHVHARALGLSHLTPAPRPIVGLPQVAAPHDGSALVEFDFGVAKPLPGTYADFPLNGNEVHELVRRNEGGIQQVDAFLRPGGQIEHFCDGPCDPD